MKFIVAFLALLSLSIILIVIGLSGPQVQPSSVAAVNIAVQRESAQTAFQVLCLKSVGALIVAFVSCAVLLATGWTFYQLRKWGRG